MKKKKPAWAEFIEQIPIIMIKGFIGCLAIGLPLEIMGVDILKDTTIHTHFYEYVGAVLVVGLPLHYFFWKT